MAFVGMGQSSRVFFRGRRSRDRFFLMKYNGPYFPLLDVMSIPSSLAGMGSILFRHVGCGPLPQWEYNGGELAHRCSARTRDVDVQRSFPVKPGRLGCQLSRRRRPRHAD